MRARHYINKVILVAVLILSSHDSLAKILPFRLCIQRKEAKKMTFNDWATIKSQLYADAILRGNDIKKIHLGITSTSNCLSNLGSMIMTKSEQNEVVKYLIFLLEKYLTDPRFRQLLEYHVTTTSQSGEEHILLNEILRFPSNVLCVIAKHRPTEDDIELIGKILIGYSCMERYLLSFFSDLIYWGNIAVARTYLVHLKLTNFTPRTQMKLSLCRLVAEISVLKSQNEVWKRLQEDYHEFCDRIQLDNQNLAGELIARNLLYQDIFLHCFERIDYQVFEEILQKDSFVHFEMVQIHLMLRDKKKIDSMPREVYERLANRMERYIAVNPAEFRTVIDQRMHQFLKENKLCK